MIKENSHKRWFSWAIAVYNKRDSRSNIMGASTTEKLSDQFSISNIQLQMQLIKLPKKTKACNNKRKWRIKRYLYRKIPLQIRELPHRSFTLDSVASNLWSLML
jgi:hypothetical protein